MTHCDVLLCNSALEAMAYRGHKKRSPRWMQQLRVDAVVVFGPEKAAMGWTDNLPYLKLPFDLQGRNPNFLGSRERPYPGCVPCSRRSRR